MLKKIKRKLTYIKLDKLTRAHFNIGNTLIEEVYKEMLKKMQDMFSLVELSQYSELKGYINSYYAYIDMIRNNLIFYRKNKIEGYFERYEQISHNRDRFLEQEKLILEWVDNLIKVHGELMNSYSWDNNDVNQFMTLYNNFIDLIFKGNIPISSYMNTTRNIIMEYRHHEEEKKIEIDKSNYILKALNLDKKIYAQCKDPFFKKEYNAATLKVFMFIENETKKMTDLDKSKIYGSDLFNKILSSTDTKLYADTKSKQDSLRDFIRSSFKLFRNPLAHNKINLNSRTSIEAIVIANYIYKELKELSKIPIGEWK